MTLRAVTLEDAAAEPVRAVVCLRRSQVGLLLLPAAILRVARFCDKYDSDDPGGDGLIRAVTMNFALDDPTVILGVFARGWKVVGHYLVSIDQWLSVKFVTIVQFELDEAVPKDLILAELAGFEEWGKQHGCDGFQILARTPAVARLFRRYGFGYRATAMRRPFAVGGDGQPSGAVPPAEN